MCNLHKETQISMSSWHLPAVNSVVMMIIIISICREQENRLSPAQVNTGKSVRLLDIIIQRHVSLFQGQGRGEKEPFISTIVFLFVITATPSVGLSQSCLFFFYLFGKNLLISDLDCYYFFFFVQSSGHNSLNSQSVYTLGIYCMLPLPRTLTSIIDTETCQTEDECLRESDTQR